MNDKKQQVHIKRAHAKKTGPLAWMATNPVAANLLMLIIMLGGVLTTMQIKKEVFPEFDLDMITVSVPYIGASPTEVESGVILAVEEAVRGVDGVKRVTGTANENSGNVTVELLLGTDRDQALSDVRSQIDRITSFPADSEEPTISLVSNRNEAISIVIYGDLTQYELHDLAEQMRLELLQSPELTVAEVDGIPPLEMSIEVSRESLNTYNLTHEQIAQTIRAASIELPAGSVETVGGDRLLRIQRKLDQVQAFEQIALISRPNGTEVLLGDIANIHDGFTDTNQSATFNGLPAVRVVVYRVGEQTPISVSDAVLEYLESTQSALPEGVQTSIWNDNSEMYRARIDLLARNAKLGLVLVLLLLTIFLEIRLAFWVTMGIPISFLGAMLLAPIWGISLNMVTLFAFILTLGIVVDDAIVVGEAVFKYRQMGHDPIDAALMGAREVAAPVTFSVITTIVAFTPLFFVPGTMGKFMVVIPAMVVTVLALSLVESLFILPAHLGHLRERKGIIGAINKVQIRFAAFIDRLIDRTYRPVVKFATRMRYATVALGIATLIATVGYVRAGNVSFNFMPVVESEVIAMNLELPASSSIENTQRIQDFILEQARETFVEFGGEEASSRGIYASVGSTSAAGGPTGNMVTLGSNLAQIYVYLVDADLRDFSTDEFTQSWRQRVGEIPGVEQLSFSYDVGPTQGGAIDIELLHDDIDVIEEAATELASILGEFEGVREINNGFSEGKEQINFRLRPQARTLGLTETDLARQIRSAFYGVEVTRQQRGREELKIFVRLPESERTSEFDIESLMIRTPQGGEIPLLEAAIMERGTAYTSIKRIDGRRAVNVTADVDKTIISGNEVISSLRQGSLQRLLAAHDGLSFDLAGEQREQADTMKSLMTTGIIALFAIFALMAISFKSYLQPLIVMTAIPFGIIGAIAGHIIMGYDLSMLSMLGMTALAGVVVNDSLVMVTATNDFMAAGFSTHRAAIEAGVRRFRPIMLTSTTTFLGLMPMMLETSTQARFLIPMAISLAFGVLFTTFVTLLIVPAFYIIIDDIKWFFGHSFLFSPHK